MITCNDAKHLFDRYLDGELSPSLQTELNTHRLNCTSCQNELAMLETCGDVVGLDVCEPVLSGSFTDRVLLAQRTRMRPQPRRWGRTLVVLGSPMAAAASIGFAMMLVLPTARVTPPRVIGGTRWAAPGALELVEQHPNLVHKLTPAAKAELASTPELPLTAFVEAGVAPLVERSRSILEGTRRSVEELAFLAHQRLSDNNDKVVAEWRSTHGGSAGQTATEQTGDKLSSPDSERLAPDPAPVVPDNDSATDRVLDPL